MKAMTRKPLQIVARRPAIRVASASAAPLVWLGLALAVLLAPSLLSLMPAAHAATAIQRCVAADGTPIYTDKPCAVFNAQRTPISGELLGRIARDRGADVRAGGDFDSGDLNSTARATPAIARRSAASGCARTPTQLTMDLQGAWALGDVNRIAESYHWVGLNHRRGQQIMQQLNRLATQALLQAEYFDARIGSGALQFADASAGGGGAAGILQVMLADGSARSFQDFEVERYRGCYFIRFQRIRFWSIRSGASVPEPGG